ncbi:MAG: uracil-DNA glycosylase family protein [Acidiferrobacteraceae bacterium]
MSNFFPAERARRIIPGIGPQDARIAVVGEAPGAYEDAQMRPFVGPAGSVLEQCLHAAGIIRAECYLTNVVKVRPSKNDITPYFNGRTFSVQGIEWVQELRTELDHHECNVIVACGGTALAALTGLYQITKLRGYVFESIGLQAKRKVIPTIHPAAALYDRYGGVKGALASSEFKPYLYRHVIATDLKKARVESYTRELIRPDRQLVYNFTTISEVLEWLDFYEHEPVVCFDIEVLNYELACIGLSSTPTIACSIPLAGRWSEIEEMQIWRGLQRVLGNPSSVKVAQNGIFDIHFLLTRCGIEIRGPLHDTMVAHSIMYPELPKGLAFLGSVYCGAQTYWKDMIKFENIKDNS